MTRPYASQIALNGAERESVSASGAALAIALNGEGKAPDWAQLLPQGPKLIGRDRREWLLRDAQAIVAAFSANNGPIVVDWEHAQEHLAPQGKEAPAAGWIEAMEVRDGQVWGKIDWTPRAAQAIADKEYRFLSPVIKFRPDTREVISIATVGLVNTPNFTMKALNARETQDKPDMDKELLKALGLPDDATLAEALNAIGKMKEAVALNSDLSRFVPRADFDKAVERAVNAEQKIKADADAAREKEIGDLVDGAVQAGKIAPANRDFYLASCRAEGGVDRFKDFVAKAESKFEVSSLDRKSPDDTMSALNADERKLLAMTNLTEQEFLAAKALGPVKTVADRAA